MCHGIGGECILQGVGSGEHEHLVRSFSAVGMGDIAIFNEQVRVGLARSERTVLPFEFVLPARLIGKVDVEITYSAFIGSGNDQ